MKGVIKNIVIFIEKGTNNKRYSAIINTINLRD